MALPKDIQQLMGIADTADRITTSVNPLQPFEIGQEIWKYNPKKHQFLTWLMQHARHRPTTQSRFGHSEKSIMPNWVQFNGVTEDTQGVTGLVFVNGAKRLTKYTRLRAPTGEVLLFTAVFATATTSGAVKRNFGTSGTPLLVKGMWCKIIAPSKPEGAEMGKGPHQLSVYKSFRTGIVEWPVEMTGTKSAERTIEGDPWATALGDSWDLAQDQLESMALFSYAVDDDDTFTEGPMHTATGLEDFCETTWEVGGLPSRMDFWDIFTEWHSVYKGDGAVVTSLEVIQLINTYAFPKVAYNQDVKADGIDIDTLLIPGIGRISLLECDLFSESQDLAGMMLLLPSDGIDYRPLIGEENRDIGYSAINQDEWDLKQGHIFGEVGYEWHGAERFGMVTGIEV